MNNNHDHVHDNDDDGDEDNNGEPSAAKRAKTTNISAAAVVQLPEIGIVEQVSFFLLFTLFLHNEFSRIRIVFHRRRQ